MLTIITAQQQIGLEHIGWDHDRTLRQRLGKAGWDIGRPLCWADFTSMSCQSLVICQVTLVTHFHSQIALFVIGAAGMVICHRRYDCWHVMKDLVAKSHGKTMPSYPLATKWHSRRLCILFQPALWRRWLFQTGHSASPSSWERLGLLSRNYRFLLTLIIFARCIRTDPSTQRYMREMIKDRLVAPKIEKHDLFSSLLAANNEDSDDNKLTESELIGKCPSLRSAR